MSLLQAWYIVPRSVGGVAACGGLGERLALLGAGGSSRGELGGGLIPSWIGGVPIGELALHSHLQKLNTRGRVVAFGHVDSHHSEYFYLFWPWRKFCQDRLFPERSNDSKK